MRHPGSNLLENIHYDSPPLRELVNVRLTKRRPLLRGADTGVHGGFTDEGVPRVRYHHMHLSREVGAWPACYSTDYPFGSMKHARAFLDNLPLSQEERASLSHRNAEQMLGL